MSRAIVIWFALACLLAPSASLSAATSARQRTFHSQNSILEILELLGAGLIAESVSGQLADQIHAGQFDQAIALIGTLDFSDDKILDTLRDLQAKHGLSIGHIRIEQVELRIDGQRFEKRSEGVIAALKKIIGFHRNTERLGSVRLTYRLRFPSFVVYRETFVEDDHVRMTTRAVGSLGRLTSATLVTDAAQSHVADGLPPDDATTRLCNILSACAPYGRCPRGPVTRLVERVMDDRIDCVLYRIEKEAIRIAREGKTSLLAISDIFLREIENGLQ